MTMSLILMLFHFQTILSFSFSSKSSNTTQLCRPDQKLALLQFSMTFSIDPQSSTCGYPKTRSWRQDEDCCSWDGVTCDEVTGHVVSLDLSCCWLYGNIPSSSSVFNLRYLQRLNLAHNYFGESAISHRFGHFTSLTHLSLSNSMFSGPIPSEISLLSTLISLDLSSHSIPEVSIERQSFERISQNLTELRDLFLDGVNMSLIPSTMLSNLSSSLRSLSLSISELQGKLPAKIFHLPHLEALDLSGNRGLTVKFPKHNWSSPLRYLDLSFMSPMGKLPIAIGNLPNLIMLDLSSNSLNGPVPSWLSNLSSLEHLQLNDNKLTGQIDQLQLPNSLKYVELQNNYIQGPIPKSLCQLVNLTFLDLSSNNLSGNIDLSSNLLQGPIPALPPSVRYFIVSNNQLNGELPPIICNSSLLEVFDVSNNSLSGNIPNCLGSLSNLSVLDLRMNGFHGQIPEAFTEGSNIRSLGLGYNQLEGLLPRSLVNCNKLELLDLGNNKINDTFPHWLGNLQELQILSLRSNSFYGLIRHPNTSFPFPKLRIMDLSHNNFIGPLPAIYFETLKAMMEVGENKIGAIYMGDGYYYDSIILTMKGVDVEFQKILTVFTTIDLSSNQFDGEIPEVVGEFQSLIVLNFSHNNLTGQIPSSMTNLIELESLDLSSNQLSGKFLNN